MMMTGFAWLLILSIKIHLLSGYEYVQNIKSPDVRSHMYKNNYQIPPRMSSAIPYEEESLSDLFAAHRYNHEDPCAILLACLLLTKSPSHQVQDINYASGRIQSPYDDSVLDTEKWFQLKPKEDGGILYGNNVNGGKEDANYMVNETVGYITQLCNTENVQGYLRGLEVDEFPESCTLDEYDITHIFTELIYLADSSIPANDGRLEEPLIQKKSDEHPLTLERRSHNYLLPKNRQSAIQRRKMLRRRWRSRKKRRRKIKKRKPFSENRNKYFAKRKRIKILENGMGSNAKFFGRSLWKPSKSEENSPTCKACEKKRSACFAYYMATYGVCGVVWYVEFITDTAGLIGDYFRPATTLCNLATYPRTADCVWNTFQNCYRNNCGLIGFEWAALPKLKGAVLG